MNTGYYSDCTIDEGFSEEAFTNLVNLELDLCDKYSKYIEVLHEDDTWAKARISLLDKLKLKN